MSHASAPVINGRITERLTFPFVPVLLMLAVFSILFQINGLPIALGGVSVSNAFVALVIGILLLKGQFLQRFPRYFVAPSLLLLSVLLLQLLQGNTSSLIFAIQSFLFMLLPYAAYRFGRLEWLIRFCFFYVLISQIYLLGLHGGTLPAGEIGGFFVSRRTVHCLSLALLGTLYMPQIRGKRVRIFFALGICLILLVSQARGATLLFGVGIIAFQSQALSIRQRAMILALLFMAVAVSFVTSPDLLAHYQAAMSLGGGSSTGYRAYLLQILVSEFDRYWLFGMPHEDVQWLLADRFTQGKRYVEFALDNSFVYFALRYGGAAVLLLGVISISLLRSRQAHAFCFVGWLFLDDIMGSGLGWFFLGLVLVQTIAVRQQSGQSTPTRRNG